MWIEKMLKILENEASKLLQNVIRGYHNPLSSACYFFKRHMVNHYLMSAINVEISL